MILEGVFFHNSTSNYPFDVILKNWNIIFCFSLLHVCFIHKSRSERSTDPDPKSVAQESGSPKLRVCRSMMQEPMMGHLTLLGSPVPSAVGSPERRGSTGPKPRVSRSTMQESMIEHLNRLGSPFPSASGSPEYRRSTDPDPK